MRWTARWTVRILLTAVVLVLPSLLGIARADATVTYLCTDYSGCNAAGLSDFGYGQANSTSYWGMYPGHNCTNYAAYRLVREGVDASYLQGQGMAYQWGTVARSHGVPVDGTPQVGDIAWWASNASGVGYDGHVAYVQDAGPGYIVISEDSFGGTFHWTRITQGGNYYPTAFIHFGGGASAPSPAKATGPAGSYQRLAPARLLDTRVGVGAPPGQVGPRSTLRLQVTGVGGVPMSNVAAVVLNVTVVGPRGPGFVTAYPDGQALPTASNLNFVAGQTVPNLVVVPVGAGGFVDLFNGSWGGSTDLLADVDGYFVGGSPTAAGGLGLLAPTRVLDTRTGTGTGVVRAVPARTAIRLPIAGSAGVPANASAVILNVTVADPTDYGYVSAYPGGTATPTASNLNFVPGQTVPNLVVVPVGADHSVELFNGSWSGSTDLIADVAGYFTAGSPPAKGGFGSVAPTRLLDTRSSGGSGAVPARGVVRVLVAGVGGVPATASAVVLNVTVADPAAEGYVTAYPDGINPPTASNLNFTPGQVVPNLVVVPVGSGGYVDLLNGSWTGPTHLIADVAGYFTG